MIEREVGMAELRESLASALADVGDDRALIVTHHGERVAALLAPAVVSPAAAAHPADHVTVSELRSQLKMGLARVARHGHAVWIHRRSHVLAVAVPMPLYDALRAGGHAAPHRPAPEVVMSKTRVITFFSHAGGVGKTSSCRDVGYELAQLGHRVLLIDLDPQANLTDWLGVDPDGEGVETLVGAVLDVTGDVTLPTPQRVHGMDLIPSSLDVAKLEAQLANMPMAETRLSMLLEPWIREHRYDYILIDPPPALGKLVALALMASHEVIIPVSSRNKGLKALKTVHDMVAYYQRYNRGLGILSHLITQMGTTSHSRSAADAVEQHLPNVSGPIRHRPAVYDECQVKHVPVGIYDAGGPAQGEVQGAVRQILSYAGDPVRA